MPDRSVSSPPSAFTASERELIRLELNQHFSSLPSVAEGLMLRVWRMGPQAGQPKLPKPFQLMLARGLVEIRTDRFPRAFFIEAGLAALRHMAADRRALDPIRYAHVLRELGLQTDEQKP
jgi:hypothetical protein